MTDTLSRAYAVDMEVRSDGSGRTVHGIVVPFDMVARVSDGGAPYDEAFQRGAFAKTIAEGGSRVKLLSQHNARTNPLGRATMLREDATGLYGEFRVSKTAAGDEALELLRDGSLDSFSVGFRPIKHENRNRVTWRTEVGLRETSLVTFPAYDGALVGGVRSLLGLTDEDIAELARMLAEHTELRSTTPDGEPGTTAAEPPSAGNEPASPLRSAAHIRNQLRAQARREGGPLA